MTVQEYLEGLMLVSFSVGWYFSIAKMLRTRQSAGKSAGFVMLVCTGYLLGLSAKLITWHTAEVFSLLVLVYGWNLLVTAFDLFLVHYYSRPPCARGVVLQRQTA